MLNILQVFWQFFVLGWVSFGGPAAHIGYFEKTFVQKLKWIDEHAYARLISLSQFLPGPGSSQIGFAIGLKKAGIIGGFAAFVAFTLPSFFILYLLSTSQPTQDMSWITNVIYGLKLFAVAVVADASINMYRAFCKERGTALICMTTAVVLLLIPSIYSQMALLVVAAIIGMLLRKTEMPTTLTKSGSRIGYVSLTIFIALFLGLPLIAGSSIGMSIFAYFFYSGSLVFGGGHVVLPMLQQTIGETMSTDQFLMGYAAAQAIPGPMFSLSAFLGAELFENAPLMGALIATIAIFLPGFLLVLSFNNAWESLAAKPRVAGAVWGINAAVVGLLVSALYQPVFTSAVSSAVDMAVVIVGLGALRIVKAPILVVISGFIAFGLIIGA